MTARRTVLVTGGAGFIGSHTCLELLEHGHDVVVADNYANSSPLALQRVEGLAGRKLAGVHEVDVADESGLARVFDRHPIDAVIHFAARKAVGESIHLPLEYHLTNLGTLLNLLVQMRAHDVQRLVFSSSCSIYGAAGPEPLTEDSPGAPTNPYARTKQYGEQILADVCAQQQELRVIALRYFNPAGAHRSGLLGEDPRGVPGNVMPYLAQVAVGRRPHLTVFGGDWPTPDGTCVRDYVHVEDVADGHRFALDHLDDATGLRVVNLGTGVGRSVLELVRAFEAACGRPLPVQIAERRPGDVAALVAAPARAEAEWGWRARYDLDRMCRDAWRFQQQNPLGYQPDAVPGAGPGAGPGSRTEPIEDGESVAVAGVPA